MSLFDYLHNKTEFIPVREMEKILWNSNLYMMCKTYDEPPGLKSTIDSYIEMPENYKPLKGKYRQCKTKCIIN